MSGGPSSPPPGGFVRDAMLPSPAPSNQSTSTSFTAGLLPHPPARALRNGGIKYDRTNMWAEGRLQHISRRFLMRWDDGYRNLKELSKDAVEVIDALWLSGTPRLQIIHLLTIANDYTQYLSALPPSQAPALAVLRRLDHCFASLLCGKDVDTQEPLPGFEGGLSEGMSVTEMVRLKSIVERAKVAATKKLLLDTGEGDGDDEGGSDSGGDSRSESGSGGSDASDEDGSESDASVYDDDEAEREVAQIYVRTLEKLGERLGGDLDGMLPR